MVQLVIYRGLNHILMLKQLDSLELKWPVSVLHNLFNFLVLQQFFLLVLQGVVSLGQTGFVLALRKNLVSTMWKDLVSMWQKDFALLAWKALVSLLLKTLVTLLNEGLVSPLLPTSLVTAVAIEDQMVDTLGSPALQTAGRNLNNH